jgi:hypothetical protein
MPWASESPALRRIVGPAAPSRTGSRNAKLKHVPPLRPWKSLRPCKAGSPAGDMDRVRDYALCGNKRVGRSA